MRLEFGALPWEMLGPRPVMLTLTYPGDWEQWVPNAEALRKHREALKERWRRRFGPPIGVWVTEFQKRGAAHFHMYLGLPDAVSDEEFLALQSRTMRRHILQRQVGPYEARKQLRAPSGEFATWLRTAWWEVDGSGSRAHYGRGVDLAVMFFSDKAEKTADRAKVAEYLWRESGKWAQKQPPEDFGSMRFSGRWGAKQGFRPVMTEQKLSEGAYYELRRVLRRLQELKRRADAERGGYRFRPGSGGSRGRDGLTVFNVDGTGLAPRLIDWAEELALVKASQADGAEPLWNWRSRVTLRAFSELELDTRPDDDEAEYEAWLEEQADAEAALEAAIERHLAERDGWFDDGWG
jgi:hypothetical protein